MSLVVLDIFRHLPWGPGSSPNEFARNFNILTGTFALFGHLPTRRFPPWSAWRSKGRTGWWASRVAPTAPSRSDGEAALDPHQPARQEALQALQGEPRPCPVQAPKDGQLW